MEVVLKYYGYSLERLESWEKHDAEDFSDNQCGVILDSKKGYFVPANATLSLSAESIETHLTLASGNADTMGLKGGPNGEATERQGSTEKELPSSSLMICGPRMIPVGLFIFSLSLFSI